MPMLVFDKNTPYLSRIKDRYFLTQNSERTCHVILEVEEKALSFEPGDSVGIYPENNSLYVQRLIDALHAQADTLVQDPKSQAFFSLSEFLSKKANIYRLTSAFLKKVLAYAKNTNEKEKLLPFLEDKEALSSFLAVHEPLDILISLNSSFIPLEEIIPTFAPLLPRFYSIASSPRMHPNEIHLTVALTHHTHKEEMRYGVASYFLCKSARLNESRVPIFVQPAPHFRLPPHPSISLIMIGPGTGIAPFRAFMQERMLHPKSGNHWLFFGERNQASDFFYQEFWQEHVRRGFLKLSTAFSRDQNEKRYVQHILYEERKHLWEWMQEGAYLYVCGSLHPMAREVETMLCQIAEEEGGLSPEEARLHIRELRKARRYLVDAY